MSAPFETPRSSAPQEPRGIPFHCPYCGDENLRPSEEGHGAWECHACLRVFSLKMLGMVPRPSSVGRAGEVDR
jgi:ribosomal protein L37AE/L43A